MTTRPASSLRSVRTGALVSEYGPEAVRHASFIYNDKNAPTPSCHASTMAETSTGIIAAWFGGKREAFCDCGIWVSHFDKATAQWSEPVEVANGLQHTTEAGDVLRYACWNPVFFRPTARAGENGRPLVLFYKLGKTPSTWWGAMMTSDDEGRSWSPSRRLPEGILGPIKNKPVELPDGTWLCPSSTEESGNTGWCIHFEMTSDEGATWTRTGPLNDGIEYGAIQPSILMHPEGRIQAIGRTQLAKRVFTTWSGDGGHSWSDLDFLNVPNPDSGTDATTLLDGRHALIYNPTESGRSPLSLALSEDGIEWSRVLDLETEPGEFSYPSILQTSDGGLHLSYTWRRCLVKHVIVDPSAL